jgi:hypothetical protein
MKTIIISLRLYIYPREGAENILRVLMLSSILRSRINFQVTRVVLRGYTLHTMKLNMNLQWWQGQVFFGN